MPWIYNGRQIRQGRAWKDDSGVAHPSNWASAWDETEKANKGLVFEAPPQPYDNRFYWGRDAQGVLIPKAIEDVAEVDENGDPVLDEKGVQLITLGLKSIWVKQVKAMANSLLSTTDWMVVRASETSVPMTTEVATRRTTIRQKADDMEQAINACTNIDEFKALFETPVDENGEPTGNPVIGDWGED